MTFQRKVPKEEYPSILERLKIGETYQSIASTYKVSREFIRQIAKKNNLHRVGLQIRSDNKHDVWLTKMNKLYGEFFDGNKVNERDVLTECKLKYSAKKANAKRCGSEFTIDFQDIVWNKVCPITRVEIDYFASGRQENSPSFDRVNPEFGYVKGNVQIISWRANRIKNDGTAKEHLAIAEYMSTVACQVSE